MRYTLFKKKKKNYGLSYFFEFLYFIWLSHFIDLFLFIFILLFIVKISLCLFHIYFIANFIVYLI